MAGLIPRGLMAASRLRGTKAFHPRGVVHDATLVVTGDDRAPAPWLRAPRSYEAVVRLSRGVGLPRPLPDVLGLAIRVLDAHGAGSHQDVLLVTSGDGPVLQHLLLPALRFDTLPYSSVAPYRTPSGLVLLGARAERPEHYRLGWAALGGRLRPFGDLRLGARQADAENALRFSVANCGGGLEPATWINRIRPAAYRGSQDGWSGAAPEALTDRRASSPPTN